MRTTLIPHDDTERIKKAFDATKNHPGMIGSISFSPENLYRPTKVFNFAQGDLVMHPDPT